MEALPGKQVISHQSPVISESKTEKTRTKRDFY